VTVSAQLLTLIIDDIEMTWRMQDVRWLFAFIQNHLPMKTVILAEVDDLERP